jgi:hypothetical protein
MTDDHELRVFDERPLNNPPNRRRFGLLDENGSTTRLT